MLFEAHTECRSRTRRALIAANLNIVPMLTLVDTNHIANGLQDTRVSLMCHKRAEVIHLDAMLLKHPFCAFFKRTQGIVFDATAVLPEKAANLCRDDIGAVVEVFHGGVDNFPGTLFRLVFRQEQRTSRIAKENARSAIGVIRDACIFFSRYEGDLIEIAVCIMARATPMP